MNVFGYFTADRQQFKRANLFILAGVLISYRILQKQISNQNVLPPFTSSQPVVYSAYSQVISWLFDILMHDTLYRQMTI